MRPRALWRLAGIFFVVSLSATVFEQVAWGFGFLGLALVTCYVAWQSAGGSS